jgi:hypothetical protein
LEDALHLPACPVLAAEFRTTGQGGKGAEKNACHRYDEKMFYGAVHIPYRKM